MTVGKYNHHVFDKAYKQLITIYYHVQLSNSSIALGVCLWDSFFPSDILYKSHSTGSAFESLVVLCSGPMTQIFSRDFFVIQLSYGQHINNTWKNVFCHIFLNS
jgi:hypothetical protein